MSNISPDFIHSIGLLYENINAQESDFLNEESEFYDEETRVLVEDIITKISLSMVYEGYSAESIIGFLSDFSEQDILEKYLNYDENLIAESTISEEYVQKQLEVINELVGALFRMGKAAFKGAKYAKGVKGAAPLARLGSALKSAGTSSERIAAQGINKSSVVRSTLGKGIQKVKDIGSKAKSALTSPTAKKVGLGAAGLGAAGVAGGIGGYIGAKLAGSGSAKNTDAPKSDSGKTTTASKPQPSRRSQSSGGSQIASSKSQSSTKSQTTASKPQPSAKSGETDMQKWARLHPNLAAKVKPGQSGYEDIQKLDLPQLDKPRTGEKQDQTPTQGSSSAQIDTKSIQSDVAAEKERQRQRAQKAAETASTGTQKESYDIILEYLLNRGHADTIEEANYIMMEMDSQTMSLIVDEYENNIIAEKISIWVNDLLEEGYDLSEYSWDDIVEYYMTENNN